MADKQYLNEQGLQQLVDFINLQITACKTSIATATQAGIIKPGTGLIVADDGTLSISQDTFSQVNSAADRASQSAIIAGNYAAQAIQAKNIVENKIWYGTMEQYNALETINSSTIYIILHE